MCVAQCVGVADGQVAMAREHFLHRWATLHPLMSVARRRALHVLQDITELEEIVQFVGLSTGHAERAV